MNKYICPKCKEKNAYKIEDDSDNWGDLCLICPDCGYDEREQKAEIEKKIKEEFNP